MATRPDTVVPGAEWQRKYEASGAARADDTVVLTGARRATLAELKAYIAEDLASRAGNAGTDG